MVVLTIVAQKNGETVYFDEPIPQVHYMRLVSCSLYNSWHNLNRVGQINLSQTGETLASIPGGHYNIHTLVRELKMNLEENKNKAGIKFETNNSSSVLRITSKQGITISHGLAALLGTGTRLDLTTHINKLNTPSAYFIHCDLIDPSNNFFNGKRSDILAKIDIRGMSYDKVSYPSLPQEALRECSTGQHVHQITLSVKD